MGKNRIVSSYYDGPRLDRGMSIEELEAEYERLKEESKNLTEWEEPL